MAFRNQQKLTIDFPRKQSWYQHSYVCRK